MNLTKEILDKKWSFPHDLFPKSCFGCLVLVSPSNGN